MQLQEGTEEFKSLKELWKERAKNMTLEELPTFIQELMAHDHDYGTVCHAIALSAVATAWAANKTAQGGITGFQAGAVMWEFIKNWSLSSNKTGMRLVDYDNFLYPQYNDEYQKTIDASIWENIQREARSSIDEADKKYAEYLENRTKYLKDLAEFIEKYPDYLDNREVYEHLGMGDSKQWEAYNRKVESGFEFAPREPYCSVTPDSRVYNHWLSIVNGVVPFGYRIKS